MARKTPDPEDRAGDSLEAQPGFEPSMDELEALVERMEQGEVPLEESLKAFERGRELIARCKAILDDAERRIAQMGLDQVQGGEEA
jgi:exodeoxyribonuclease VII small subunit